MRGEGPPLAIFTDQDVARLVAVARGNAGSGDDAASRRVKVTIELPVEDAMILGDSLNLFQPDFKLTAESTMRKEGELAVRPST
mgnify:CR=1 FL=1